MAIVYLFISYAEKNIQFKIQAQQKSLYALTTSQLAWFSLPSAERQQVRLCSYSQSHVIQTAPSAGSNQSQTDDQINSFCENELRTLRNKNRWFREGSVITAVLCGWVCGWDKKVVWSIRDGDLTATRLMDLDLFKVKLSPKYNQGFFVNVPESNLHVKA